MIFYFIGNMKQFNLKYELLLIHSVIMGFVKKKKL